MLAPGNPREICFSTQPESRHEFPPFHQHGKSVKVLMASMVPAARRLPSNVIVSLRPQWPILPARFLLPAFQVRTAKSGTGFNPQKFNKKEGKKKKKKADTRFTQYDLRDAEQFALCDAMRQDGNLSQGSH